MVWQSLYFKHYPNSISKIRTRSQEWIRWYMQVFMIVRTRERRFFLMNSFSHGYFLLYIGFFGIWKEIMAHLFNKDSKDGLEKVFLDSYNLITYLSKEVILLYYCLLQAGWVDLSNIHSYERLNFVVCCPLGVLLNSQTILFAI